MKYLKQILTAILMGLIISVGAVAQKGRNENRPPKEDQKIKERDKPPPSNNNRGQSNSNRKRP